MNTKLVFEVILGFLVLFTLTQLFLGQVINFKEQIQIIALLSIVLSGVFYLFGKDKGKPKKTS